MNAIAKTQPRGLEGMDPKDIKFPRVILMQSGSNWVKDEKAKAGTFVNSISKEKIATNLFVPVKLYKWWDLYKPGKTVDQGEYEGRTSTEPTDRDFYNTRDGSPYAIGTLAFLSLFGSKPMMLSFSKSNYGIGRDLLSMISEQGGDIFSWKYELSAAKRSNEKTSWWGMDVRLFGQTAPDEFAMAEDLFNRVKGRGPVGSIDGETLETEPF